MYSPSRLFVAILVVVAAVVLFTALMRAQARQPPAPTEAADLRHPLSYVEDKARAAVTGQPIAVRAYTDEIFARSLLAPAASSLKERVFKNELAFRTGGHVGILEQDIVTTVNNHVEQLKAPLFLRLSIGQLQIARQNLLKHVPANSDPAKGSPTQVLSPAEA